ncbi:FIMAH domain-containing protein [Actinoplanes missouriensis]|uniref:FIMAH domain-containing protein n=1 Tax=Actinoplanes missouriensis TaxID=1866 RepID=UPI0012F8E453|nr:hypothetical protein [Actinoplanes missouriensis]
MSVPHDPYYSPTTKLPVVKPSGAGVRLKILGAITAATVVIVSVAVWIISPGSSDGDETAAVPLAVPSAIVTEPSPELTAEVEPSVTPSTAPTSKPTPATTRPVRPAELVTQLMTVVRALEKRGELDDDGAKALNRRLQHLKNRLRKDPEKASGKLDEFVKKLADLREDGDISEDGFQALAAGATQIGAVLPAAGSGSDSGSSDDGDDDDDDDDD